MVRSVVWRNRAPEREVLLRELTSIRREASMAKMSDLLHYLNSNKVDFQVIEHDPAYSAHDVAVATHVPEGEMAKAIVVRIDDHLWMAVLRSDQRINQQMIRRVFGARNVHLAH